MSEDDPIRVLVVDDQDLVRGGFKAILGTYEGIEIVGEARNGADAVQEAQRLRPDVVLVVDDQDLVRGGFKAILGTYEGIEIVGEARNGADAVQEAQRLRPDVVLMDIRMPEMNGIEATRAITGNPLLAKTRVLVLTTFDVDEYVYDALGAGASGFLLKDADPDEIVAAIRVVARGDALIQPSVMRRLVETFVAALGAGASGFLLKDADPDEIVAAIRVVARGDALIQPSVMRRLVETFVAARPRGGWGAADVAETRRAALTSLTDRAREILVLVARGLSTDEIAEELFISPATVKTQLARVMAKTDAHDRAQLVVFAYETGLVTPAP